jgi:biopolymer transport protein ExbB
MWLLLQGGVIMIPIGVASIIATAIILEQLLSLRTQRIMPRRLIDELSELADRGRLLDPRKAYQICQDYPSAASRIIRAALLKVGRPQAEIEQTVNDTCQREADRLHAHVRWLYMITTIAPLLGLLGTVWGMIRSFYDMTLLTGGQNRAVFLAAGIYTALVTTLAGLTVAIPTAVAAHFFEGRIISLLHRITDFVANLLPQWEPFEGKVRVTPEALRPAAGGSNGADGESTRPDAIGEPKLSASG